MNVANFPPTSARDIPQPAELRIAHSRDSDDAFYYAALKARDVSSESWQLTFCEDNIVNLNEAALTGRFHVVATSSVMYPLLARNYCILSCGTSVGRNYGPLLASAQLTRPEQVAGKRVGVAGLRTTGAFLLRLLHPEAVLVPWDDRLMAQAVLAGDLDAAVLIHEELLLSQKRGLKALECLGKSWCQSQGQPLPVGLNLVHRSLGIQGMARICAAIEASLRWGLDHQQETLVRIARHDRGAMQQFVAQFANQDSLKLAADVRRALGTLLLQVARVFAEDPLTGFEVVSPDGLQLTSTLATA